MVLNELLKRGEPEVQLPSRAILHHRDLLPREQPPQLARTDPEIICTLFEREDLWRIAADIERCCFRMFHPSQN